MILSENATDRLVRFVTELNFEDIPENVIDRIKQCVLDILGVSLLAYVAESTEPVFRAVKRFAGTGRGTVIGSSTRLPYQYAALLNGTLAHTPDFDDTNVYGGGHPAAPIISASLAAAELKGSSGADFLCGVIAGYEVMSRLGAALGEGAYDRGFHPTSITGIYGATAAVCRIVNAGEEVTKNAFGLALSMASGSMQYLENGAWNKRLHPGLAAYKACLSLSMAEEGVLGASSPLEGKFGYLRMYSDNTNKELLANGLGREWYTLKTAIKPYPSCRFTHGTIDAVRQLKAENELRPENVQNISISLSPIGYKVVGEASAAKIAPTSEVDGQFSVYFQVAAALLDGNVTWNSYRRLGQTEIRAITEKVRVHADPSLDKLSTKVEIKGDGTTCCVKIDYPKGEQENPMQWVDIEEKFILNSKFIFSVEKMQSIISAVKCLERQPDMSSWVASLGLTDNENIGIK